MAGSSSLILTLLVMQKCKTSADLKLVSDSWHFVTLFPRPVYWKSSVIQCYANENFEEDHPDRSSGASETRGAGNATMDFLHLSYIAREAGIKFPKPFILQIDNDAARIFANDTCFRSRMKHIDCAQEWVRMLRDRAICLPTWVGTDDNLADIFTKIPSVKKFHIMRGRIMVERSS